VGLAGLKQTIVIQISLNVKLTDISIKYCIREKFIKLPSINQLMSVEFCPNCKGVLQRITVKVNDVSTKAFRCDKCGFVKVLL